MNMNIVVPDQVAQALRRKAAILEQDLEEYVQRLVAEDVADEFPTPPVGESADAFMTRLRAMIDRHAIRSGHVDDSRESIYAGRGE
jgi:hypothetical protein